MKRVRVSNDEFIKIIDECKIKDFCFSNDVTECKFEFRAEKVCRGDIFIALDSSKYSDSDGALGFTNNEDSIYGLGGYINLHDKIGLALKNGAKTIVVDNLEFYQDDLSSTFILVKDCLEVIIKLTKNCLIKSEVKIIAVTGSTGKTTVTTALCDFLSIRFRVNRIHCIRTSILGIVVHVIQELYDTDNFLIIEMQLDGLNQIKRFCEIAQPDYSIITSINLAHYSRFRNIDVIFNEKIQVYRSLKKDGKLIINGDDEILRKRLLCQNDKRIHMVSLKNVDADILLENIDTNGKYSFNSFSLKKNGFDCGRYKMNAVGIATLYGAAYAMFFAKEYEFTVEDIQKGLYNIKSSIGRLQGFEGINESLVIMDTYNANYYSIIGGLDYLMSLSYTRKVVVLGSMMELGEKTEIEHQKVGKYIEKYCDIDYLITIGEAAMYIAQEVDSLPSNCKFSVYDYESAIEILNNIRIDSSTVLYFKGSGCMRMELLIPFFLSKKVF